MTNFLTLPPGQCPTLSRPSDGSIFYPGGTNQLGAVATYICTAGNGIDRGDQIRVCDGTTWSGTAPECNGNQTMV